MREHEEIDSFYGEDRGVFYTRWIQEGERMEILEHRLATQEEASLFWYKFFSTGGLPCGRADLPRLLPRWDES